MASTQLEHAQRHLSAKLLAYSRSCRGHHEIICQLVLVGVRFSPTFAFYNTAGRKVDEVTGKDPQRLADHLWLHSD
eukprot:550886-Pelagomonas_calceolata.AAC.1